MIYSRSGVRGRFSRSFSGDPLGGQHIGRLVSDRSGDLRWSLQITEERQQAVLVLTVRGRLGQASAGTLDAAIRAAGGEPAGFVIDLTQVDYISSAALVAIDGAAGRLAASRRVLVLCAVPEPVRIALELSGLLSRVSIEPTRERAVARVASGAG